MLTSLLFALVTHQGAAQSPQGGLYPSATREAPFEDLLKWSGFTYLPAGDRELPRLFEGPGDWSAVEAAGLGPDAPDATPWRLKVFVLRRIDRVETLPDGTLWLEKCVLETPDIERIRRSVLQLQGLVKAETEGKLKLVPDVVVEDEAITEEGRPISKIASDYIYPRVNGGLYEAEDHVYRGPYDSVICVQPIPGTPPGSVSVNDTPVGILSGYGSKSYQTDGLMAVQMAQIWLQQVQLRARRAGILGPLQGVRKVRPETGLANPNLFAPEMQWAPIKLGEDQPDSVISGNLKLPVDHSAPEGSDGGKLLLSSSGGAGAEARIEKDSEHGSVLKYSETGSARAGWVSLPGLARQAPYIDVAKTPSLRFWAKSATTDPLALYFVKADAATGVVCLGRDMPGPRTVPQADFARDGQWHEVSIDLKSTGLDQIGEIYLAPTPNSSEHTKQTLGPIQYSFAEFRATTDAPQALLGPVVPDADSPDPLARAEWAHSASSSAKLLELLRDPDWSVRFNAIQHYISNPSADAEPALLENARLAIDGSVSAAAADALWKLGSDAGKAEVAQMITLGLTEQGKAEAADLLTRSGDGSMAPKLIVLNQSRSLRTRIAAVRALARLSGPDSAIIRSTFLFQVDPELKLEVTRTLDPDDSVQVKKLLWSAVNEPSDAVRAESDLKLIQSKDADIRKEGFKGVKDDSVEVRLMLLRDFAAHPSESDRDAARLAVIDRSSRVRAAALHVFSVLPKGVSSDELGTVVDDPHPNVQLALLELQARTSFKLPPNQIAQMKNSPDPEVREAAKRLLP